MNRPALALTVLIVSAIAVPAGDGKADLDALQGQWVITSFVFDGAKRPEDYYKTLRLEIKGDQYIITVDGETALRTIKLDATKAPKWIDVTYADGPNKGKTTRCIYTLDGDTFQVCRHQQPAMERPAEFRSEAGSQRAFITWKRVK